MIRILVLHCIMTLSDSTYTSFVRAAAGLVSQINLDIGLQKYYKGMCVNYIQGISR